LYTNDANGFANSDFTLIIVNLKKQETKIYKGGYISYFLFSVSKNVNLTYMFKVFQIFFIVVSIF